MSGLREEGYCRVCDCNVVSDDEYTREVEAERDELVNAIADAERELFSTLTCQYAERKRPVRPDENAVVVRLRGLLVKHATKASA